MAHGNSIRITAYHQSQIFYPVAWKSTSPSIFFILPIGSNPANWTRIGIPVSAILQNLPAAIPSLILAARLVLGTLDLLHPPSALPGVCISTYPSESA